jgi:small subunit ribosomal protein S16
LSVKIRLLRAGAKHRPFYRVVVTDSRSPRDGRFIEMLGYYDPLPETELLKIDEEKAKHWIERGAVPSTTVKSLLKRAQGAATAETQAEAAKARRQGAIEEANKLAPAKPKPKDEKPRDEKPKAAKTEPPKAAAPKPAPAKPEAKPAAKAEAAPAPKPETKPDAKAEAAAPKPDAKATDESK